MVSRVFMNYVQRDHTLHRKLYPIRSFSFVLSCTNHLTNVRSVRAQTSIYTVLYLICRPF